MVLVETPADPGDVEAPVVRLPARVTSPWRHTAWIPALLAAVALVGYERLAPGRGWVLPPAMSLATTAAVLATAFLALVRYRDDREQAALRRDAPEFLARAATTTGTVIRVAGRPAVCFTTAEGTGRTEPGSAVGHLPDGEPVAVWYAPDNPIVLVRHHPAWAEQLRSAAGRGSERTDEAPGETDSGTHPRDR